MRDTVAERLDFKKWQNWLEKGVVYAHGRDKHMRPILHVNLERFGQVEPTVDDILGVTDYMHAYLSFNAMIPGTVEQWVVIWDCKNMPVSSFPMAGIPTMAAHGTYAWKQRNA